MHLSAASSFSPTPQLGFVWLLLTAWTAAGCARPASESSARETAKADTAQADDKRAAPSTPPPTSNSPRAADVTSEKALSDRFEYPAARRGDQTDDYHGMKVADPYRWLEDPDSPETRTWIEAENKLTFCYLKQIPEREGDLKSG